MAEECTTPDLVELVCRRHKAAGDVDAMMSFYAPNAVWDMTPMGLGTYEGAAAIRSFFEDWSRGYEEWEVESEEIIDYGDGVTLAVLVQDGCPVGGAGHVQLRYATVSVWVDGLVVRTTNYSEIDEARAAAERLAEERG